METTVYQCRRGCVQQNSPPMCGHGGIRTLIRRGLETSYRKDSTMTFDEYIAGPYGRTISASKRGGVGCPQGRGCPNTTQSSHCVGVDDPEGCPMLITRLHQSEE